MLSGTGETSRKRKSSDINDNNGPEPMVFEVAEKTLRNGTVSSSLDDKLNKGPEPLNMVVEVAEEALTKGTVTTSLDAKLEKEYGKEWKKEANAQKIHMIPDTFTSKGTKDSPTGAKAEHAIYDTLQKLNDESKASIRYYCRKMFGFVFHGQKFEGEEIDFIFITISGLIIIECKGIQNKSKAQEKYEDAFVQLRRKVVSLGLPDDIPILKVVAFPLLARCDIEEYDETSVLFKDDLNDLKHWLGRTKFLRPSISFGNYVKSVTTFLSKYHRNGTANFNQFKKRGISDVNDRLIFYTKEQAKLLKSDRIQDKYITGAAGTGKTFALKERVKSLTERYKDEESEDEGKKILVIAYNVPITRDIELWVEENAKSDGRRLVRVQTFTGLLWDIRRAVRDERPPEDANDQEIVDFVLKHNVLNNYFKSKCTKTPQFIKYRHILVDEAQDLPGKWFSLLFAMLDKEKESDLWIFEDLFQEVRRDISTHINKLPATFTRHSFTKVVRNTRNIFKTYQNCHEMLREGARFSGALSKELLDELSPPIVGHDVYGLRPECITKEDNMQLKEVLVSTIKDLQSKGVPFCDIAVVTCGGCSNKNINAIKKHLDAAGIKCNDAEEGTKMKYNKRKQADPPIIVDTYQRFKGLEAKVLIFYIPREWSKPRLRDVYVGFSRAFCHLILIGPKKQIKQIKEKELEY